MNLAFQPVARTNLEFLTRAKRQAEDKLLQAVTIDMPAPGWWAVEIFIRRDREAVVLATKPHIMPAASRLATLWPFLYPSAFRHLPPSLFTRRSERSRPVIVAEDG